MSTVTTCVGESGPSETSRSGRPWRLTRFSTEPTDPGPGVEGVDTSPGDHYGQGRYGTTSIPGHSEALPRSGDDSAPCRRWDRGSTGTGVGTRFLLTSGRVSGNRVYASPLPWEWQ